MAKRWVLNTETKGTGAEMVPVDKTHAGHEARPTIVVREQIPVPEKPPEPIGPRRFRVVEVTTRRVLADDATTREMVDVLRGVRSVVDVDVHVWIEKEQAWRRLTQHERAVVWRLRDS